MSITSLYNPKIKEAIKLRERRAREQSGLFLIEGYRELKRAVESGSVRLARLFFAPELFLGENESALIAEAGVEAYSCTPQVFGKLSYRDRPDGLIAVAYQMRRALADLLPFVKRSPLPFLLIAEAIEKPGNLGTILRSSDAVGLDGVVVCDRCTDIYNPNVVRSSVGTLFTLPVVEAGGAETLLWLRKRGIQLVAATPSADLDFTEADFTAPLAIAVGTEQLGLSAAWMQAADLRVRIPMRGAADSLNVATATTLLLYEVLRQRRSDVSFQR